MNAAAYAVGTGAIIAVLLVIVKLALDIRDLLADLVLLTAQIDEELDGDDDDDGEAIPVLRGVSNG